MLFLVFSLKNKEVQSIMVAFCCLFCSFCHQKHSSTTADHGLYLFLMLCQATWNFFFNHQSLFCCQSQQLEGLFSQPQGGITLCFFFSFSVFFQPPLLFWGLCFLLYYFAQKLSKASPSSPSI